MVAGRLLLSRVSCIHGKAVACHAALARYDWRPFLSGLRLTVGPLIYVSLSRKPRSRPLQWR
jgi:hypothetical protein